jgi:hypothetical protein
MLRSFLVRHFETGKKIKGQNVHKCVFYPSLFQGTSFPTSSLLYRRVALCGTVCFCGVFSCAFGVRLFGGKVNRESIERKLVLVSTWESPTASVVFAAVHRSERGERHQRHQHCAECRGSVADAVHANLSTCTLRVAYITDLSHGEVLLYISMHNLS